MQPVDGHTRADLSDRTGTSRRQVSNTGPTPGSNFSLQAGAAAQKKTALIR
jgi:hypothetical protein